MNPVRNFNKSVGKSGISNGVKVVFCSSEVFGFAKTGGLGDVAAALPAALVKENCEVKVFMPLYKGINPQKMHKGYGTTIKGGIEFFFIKNDEYFLRDSIYVGADGRDYPDSVERFSFYSRRVLEILEEVGFRPDIIHCNDWQASLVNVYLKTLYGKDKFFKNTKSVLTIHNMAYQGIFPKKKFSRIGIDAKYFDQKYLEFYGKVNLLKGGIVFSDVVTTVSPTYAKQIKTPEYGCGLEGVLAQKGKHELGILNAIDYDVWDPSRDELIYKKYSPKTLDKKAENKLGLQKELGLKQDSQKLLLGMVSRLAEQKGIDILSKALDSILGEHQVVILGLGEPRYHKILKDKEKKFKDSLSVSLKFDETLAHKIYAGCDVFLLPSRFEPCGLSQMISYKYATLPLVNHTGGLVDTVIDVEAGGGGFVFKKYDRGEFIKTVSRGARTFRDKKRWKSILEKVTKYNFSWEIAASKYIRMYKRLIKN